jgi:TolB-like protein/class 3 adenylate cyclase
MFQVKVTRMQAASTGRDDGTPRVKRRLAAIAFADVVGYSILMAQDETYAHGQWMALLSDIIRPQASAHQGSVIKLLGDGVLLEFSSAFDAVDWARDVQRSIQPETDRAHRPVDMTLRIAIHLGDVIDMDGDIYGDGVNIAARLQEHAPPGGIVLSEVVHDLVRGSIGLQARDLGSLELKNLEKPVRAYVLDSEVHGLVTPSRPRRQTLPSIAVLPLQNIGGDPADEYFSDGVVEDITLSLAGLHELIVISRSSTLAYRGRQPDPREVGRALSVRYVMTGTVRRSERLVRVSVELCDATTGASLWGERAAVPPGELFDVQDRIVAKIVAGIAPNVRAAEMRAAMRKRPESFTAYDYTLRGLHILNGLDAHTFPRALEFFNKAMEEDSNFAMPIAWAARWYSLNVGQGWSGTPDEDRAKALELAAQAIERDPSNALALATYGHLKSYLAHDYDSALVYFDRALTACPNHSLAWILSAGTLSYVGRTKDAVEHAERGLRLSPLDRGLFYYYMFLMLSHYADGSYDEAAKWGRLSMNENPTYTATHRFFAASLVAIGKEAEAREIVAAMLQLEPDFHISTYATTRQPFRDPVLRDRLLGHLQKAGFPE